MYRRGLLLTLLLLVFLSAAGTWSAPPKADSGALAGPAVEKSADEVKAEAADKAQKPAVSYLEYNEPEPIAAPKTLPLLIKTIISMIIIIGLIYLSIYAVKQFMGRRTSLSRGGNLLKTIDVIYLSPQRTVYLLGVPDKILVVGATDQNLNLLTEITDPRLVDGIKEKGFVNFKESPSFKEQLLKFSGSFKP